MSSPTRETLYALLAPFDTVSSPTREFPRDDGLKAVGHLAAIPKDETVYATIRSREIQLKTKRRPRETGRHAKLEAGAVRSGS